MSKAESKYVEAKPLRNVEESVILRLSAGFSQVATIIVAMPVPSLQTPREYLPSGYRKLEHVGQISHRSWLRRRHCSE